MKSWILTCMSMYIFRIWIRKIHAKLLIVFYTGTVVGSLPLFILCTHCLKIFTVKNWFVSYKRKERKAELSFKCTRDGKGLPAIERNLAMNLFLNPFLLLIICNQDFICRIFLVKCPRFWLVIGLGRMGEQKLILKICPQGSPWLTPPWPPHFLLRA